MSYDPPATPTNAEYTKFKKEINAKVASLKSVVDGIDAHLTDIEQSVNTLISAVDALSAQLHAMQHPMKVTIDSPVEGSTIDGTMVVVKGTAG